MTHSALKTIASVISRTPVIGPVARRAWRSLLQARARVGGEKFESSGRYWEDRYAAGGHSGTGSYGQFAEFKAEWINGFLERESIERVVELGCGDGNQLSLMAYPRYIGLDISSSVVARCAERFSGRPNWEFRTYTPPTFDPALVRSDLSLSLDVIFHLVEESVFEKYMSDLFACSSNFVVIYSDDSDENHEWQGEHIRHHRFTAWVESNAPEWTLIERVPNRYPFRGDYQTGSYADFYVYQLRK